MDQTRVLIAMGGGYRAYRAYRAYREVIAAGLGMLRPDLEVVAAGTGALEGEELGRLDPQVVVCHGPAPAGADGRLAWIELPPNPIGPMKVSLDGRRYPVPGGPTLGALLAVVDGAERLSRAGRPPVDPSRG